jgi:E3 SUMO-protein ligase NSE2
MALNEIYVQEKDAKTEQYNAKTDEVKYGNVAEFQDFKSRVWDVNHPDTPPPPSWFTAAIADDDDLVVGREVQSIRCPITLVLLDKPVRSTKCPHVYSLNAIKELVRQGQGSCDCPVPGCGQRIRMETLKEDKAMARRVRQEKARLEDMEAQGRMDVEVLDDQEVVLEEEDSAMAEVKVDHGT